MKKKILAMALSVIALMSTSVSAYEYKEPVDIDPFNNELFEIVGEISEEEYFAIGDSLWNDDYSYNYDSEYFHLFYDMRDDEKYPYNDGLKKDYYEYVEEDGSTYTVSGLLDVNGEVVFSNPMMEISAMAASYSYNLGYVKETVANFLDDRMTGSTFFTDVFTGDGYYFEVDDNESTPLLNDGSFYFKYQGKYYKSMLKRNIILTVALDGQKLYFDQVPVSENGRVLVPLRAIFEALGATVDWNGETQTVTATKDDITVSLTLDDTTATKNDETITLDVPAKAVNGRTLVPVRFIADSFGVDVQWDGKMQRVVLTTK